jgi:hypothetical protein
MTSLGRLVVRAEQEQLGGSVLPHGMRQPPIDQTPCCNRSWVCKASAQPVILGMAASISR